MIEPFRNALPILRKIESFGYQAFFVGGSIRDYLLNRPIADVDIATSANPEEIKKIFPQTVDIGIEHGTVLVHYHKENYEVTTFRTESEYRDYRHPEKVEFIRSLIKDLERRDFTMNAIAMNQFGELQDPFNGKEDIHKKMIRTVGEAKSRFQEDALRMMRAVRFVSQLDFTIAPETEDALHENAHLLNHIAVERKTNEFIKLLKGKAKSKAIPILLRTSLVHYLPGRQDTQLLLLQCMDYEIDSLSETQFWIMMLGFFSGDIKEYLKKWRLSNNKIKYLETSVKALRFRQNGEWNLITLYSLPFEMAVDIETVYRTLHHQNTENIHQEIAKMYSQLVIKSRDELAVSGHDVITWLNRTGGPWVKDLLAAIEEAVILKTVENKKEAIRRWVLKLCCHQ